MQIFPPPILGLFMALALAAPISAFTITRPPRAPGMGPVTSEIPGAIPGGAVCDFFISSFKIHDSLACQIDSEEDTEFGKLTVLHQSFQGFKLEPTKVKINELHGRTIITGDFYLFPPTLSSVRISQEQALLRGREALSSYFEERDEKLEEEEEDSTTFETIDGPFLVFTAPPDQLGIQHLRLAYKENFIAAHTPATVYIDADTEATIWVEARQRDARGTTKTGYYGQQKIDVTRSGWWEFSSEQEGERNITLIKCPYYSPSNCWYYGQGGETIKAGRHKFGEGDHYDDRLMAAYFAAEQIWDFNKYYYNFTGFDNLGSKIEIVGSKRYRNAYWTVYNGKGIIGVGYGFYELASLEIIGHEMVHGVIDGTADLVYSREPGALNEGFADAFGILYYQQILNRRDTWALGTEESGFRRSISDPKSSRNPDTYKGKYWYTGSRDNGGVHTNSGVLAHIFYMLSVGKVGTNDNGDKYEVKALGNHIVGRIMFRALKAYLTRYSDYEDARNAMMQAAEDIYWPEVKEIVKHAFYAGGVGCLDGFVKYPGNQFCIAKHHLTLVRVGYIAGIIGVVGGLIWSNWG